METSLEQLIQELNRLLDETQSALAGSQGLEQVETLRVQVLGRRGRLNGYFSRLSEERWSHEERAALGKKLNGLKAELTRLFEEASARARPAAPQGPQMDLTLPGLLPSVGRLHPITQTIQEIVAIFRGLGFSPVEGPEIETEENNFEALNIPADHPSRESLDTFYLESNSRLLLRSHTSPVQVRFMKAHAPPLQILVPGRVFRRDAVDASHSFQFHQVEGLAVGLGITLGDLKGTLTAFSWQMFGAKARLRFRPHYFPFTEPSAEGDLACSLCDAKGCSVCGMKGWLEILGCGMVHPAVFQAVGYPVGTVGFAFGMGVERIAMLKHGIDDIRLFSENDLRFLQQFP